MKQTISLQVDEDIVAKLKLIAEKDSRTVSSLLRVIINNYLENQNEKI